MSTNRHTGDSPGTNRFAAYLRDCRARLDPAAFGFSTAGRRTPGLRREEVAQRANISATWYTWLEQGRGGAPSAAVLERIARALVLTEVEREHLFLLALGRPPGVRQYAGSDVSPRLQRLLDALEPIPALIRTATWDVVAWNRAVAVLVADYGAMPPARRNILRFMFLDANARTAQPNWEQVARFVVGAFRIDVERAGAAAATASLVEELCRQSPEFAAMWQDNDVRAPGDAVKHIEHPVLGRVAFEYSVFAIDGRPDLAMTVYHPLADSDIDRIGELLGEGPRPSP